MFYVREPGKSFTMNNVAMTVWLSADRFPVKSGEGSLFVKIVAPK